MNIESAIGIDLGTTNSCVAVVIDGVAEVISNEYQERTTPSVVSIFENGTRYVGKQAKDAQYKNLQNTIYGKFCSECCLFLSYLIYRKQTVDWEKIRRRMRARPHVPLAFQSCGR